MWADSLMRFGCGVLSSLNDYTSSLLWLSSALVPPVLTETITPSYPVAGDRSVHLGPCTTRHLARARERSKSWASKDAQPRQ